ncbi:endonuclease/exonuclease/phosphatase family protein [Halarcobacter anaerophilus]|uniref:endonuclease/exonuclease/phosphatase family protein n=1 Tax=Halarcobacter anaerophilus TaxID=877500 RepID=UPI0006960B60|nr:endonuclease/exonuclease/phosphatase family protein [Halarcobacter anaerophilus]
MLKPIKTVSSLKHQDIKSKNTLNILCWNVAKLTKKELFKKFFEKLIKDEKLDFLILQEVKSDISKSSAILEDFSFVISPNMQTKKHIYGVMNAFNISCESNQNFLTSKKELKVATHKSILITKHTLNDKNVLVVNIHALNFVSFRDFKYELESLKEELKSYKDSLIVAGDFNTWNRKRVLLLKNFCEELFLQEVTYKEIENIKKVFKNSIDYIFFRGLNLQYSKVIDTNTISDHNPIIASFTI